MGQVNRSESVFNFPGNIVNIMMLPHNSASPTFIWKIGYDDNVTNEFKCAIIKFFHYTSKSLMLPEKKSLLYEMSVYKEFILPLLQNRVCPHFVNYLSSGDDISSDLFINILSENT